MSDAGRVIAGSAKGVRLAAPGEGTRPLSDRVKQTLFAILEPDLPGARVLDLFAGSGAGGIEALSRGASGAVFVERDAAAVRVIDRNLSQARLLELATVRRAEAIVYLRERAAADGPFDVVIVDPPYADTETMGRTIGLLEAQAAALLTERAWVVVKHFWRTPPPPVSGLLASVRSRRFGETTLSFYRRADAADGAGRDGSVEAPSRADPAGGRG
jgi:16S rRNA (guanine966-N2)-methyltransferase